ncbi:MAG TPA: hypothetical protein VGJ00_00620 [Rhabdochlamydiaceae bacterium]|jgi:TPR repeat protein
MFKLIILIISICAFCGADEMRGSIPKLDALMREFIATEDCVIWFGRGCPIAKFESRKVDSGEKSKLIDAGLEYLKNNYKDVISNEVLARYYTEREEYPKSLYWALSGAEKGSNYCMSILRGAYANGLGVVEDQIEASKWMHLAAALGNKEEKKLLGIIDDLNAKCFHTDSRHEEGRKGAQEWMRQHSDLFLQRH